MLPIAAVAAGKVLGGAIVQAVGTTIGIGLIDSVTGWVKSGGKATSLADVGRPARVEFTALIDDAIARQPYMQDLCKLALSQAAGYYLNAVNMICGVGNINTLAVFDSLNPHRSIGGGTIISDAVRNTLSTAVAGGVSAGVKRMGLERYAEGLPSLEAFGNGYDANVVAVASLEAAATDAAIQGRINHQNNNTSASAPNGPAGGGSSSFGQFTQKSSGSSNSGSSGSSSNSSSSSSGNEPETAKDQIEKYGASISDGQKIYEAENLAVGKMLNVELRDGDQRAKIPVLLRLIPAPVESETLAHIFSAGGRDNWAQRFFMVKTGQLRFWQDFVAGQDLIDAHAKALMSDKSGVYKDMMDRRANNAQKAMTTGRVSLADASNIAIVSDQTLKLAGSKLYGKIEQKSVRDAIFENSYLMTLMIVEERTNRVTIYTRGIDMSSTYRIDEVKVAEKNKGSDIGELFKVFNKAMQTNI